jgi:putative membrane protein
MMWGEGWGWGFGMLSMVGLWILVIVGLVLVVKWVGSASDRSGPVRESALEVLKKRYAKGEIGREEFDQKKRDLEG